MSENENRLIQQQLWAPWRLAYIASSDKPKQDGCFLCRYRDLNRDAENLVVYRGTRVFTVLNRYPYNNGHLLIAPLDHRANLSELDDTVLLECMWQLNVMVTTLSRVLSAEGFNVGLNLGRVAGAGVPGHLHWHVVPRWNGDTNFMPVMANVKVIPQSLEALFLLMQADLSQHGCGLP